MNLQFLFNNPIISVHELSPGYDDHASDVWLVKTLKEESVVRSSRMKSEPSNDFWWGCKRLFGINPRNVWELEEVNNTLKMFSSIPVPQVLQKGIFENRQCVVVEKLEGHVLTSLIDQSESILESLGEGLASIHRFQSEYAGNPAKTYRVPMEHFHKHLSSGMEELVSKFYSETEIESKLLEMIESLMKLPTPNYATFVLIDMDPTQFLTDGSQITGLVDTEAYVLAPREFDLIGLEYILDKKSAAAFQKGYEKIMPLPNLTQCRRPYRYLYRLLSVQGSVEINKWLQHPSVF
jgi:fructosamine-3-kinase